MKLVTYLADDGLARVGALVEGKVRDASFDGDMVALIAAWPEVEASVRLAVAGSGDVVGATLLAPLRPRSLRDFLAFEGHLRNVMPRLGRSIAPEWYDVPAYYKGLPDTVIGPDAPIPWPAHTDRLDHELELAAIIGRAGRDIAPEAAMDHIFGWTIWNDLSARDVQTRELPIGMGPAKAKDWDGSNVLGPCIVTRDELDGRDIALEVRINGERWGGGHTSEMHHPFERLISYASQGLTLRPGEVFGSGTLPGGSGAELDRWLRPGDVIEMEAEGIGILRNVVQPKEGA